MKKGLSAEILNLRTDTIDLDDAGSQIFSAWTPMGSLALLMEGLRAQGSVGILDTRYDSFDGVNSGDDRTQIALCGQNLADEACFTFGSGLANTFGIAARFYGPPRTWGPELSHRF
ncbi:MAG: hypothetical protein P8R42_01950 [Candidatus Binatia bacterium]|nr:hypothetical protein [Candidatus Binatia bacterium]